MDILPREAIDPRAALRALPPLIKGYLRLGAYIGDGAVVDHEFGTTDVLIVLPVSVIKQRYLEHFDSSRRAAEILDLVAFSKSRSKKFRFSGKDLIWSSAGA